LLRKYLKALSLNHPDAYYYSESSVSLHNTLSALLKKVPVFGFLDGRDVEMRGSSKVQAGKVFNTGINIPPHLFWLFTTFKENVPLNEL